MTETCVRKSTTVWPACKCPPCRVTTKRLTKLVHVGAYKRIPPEVGLAALDRMVRAGYSNLAIGSAAGVNPQSASHWLARRRRGLPLRLGPRTCYALLHAHKPTDGSVGAVVARRKLQALARIGHSCNQLAARYPGLKATTLCSVRIGDTNRIHAALALQIDDAYRDLWTKPSNSWKARRAAEKAQWPGPLSWDDIDDLDCVPDNGIKIEPTEPDVVAVWLAVTGNPPPKLARVDRWAIVQELQAMHAKEWLIEDLSGLKLSRYPALAQGVAS